MKEEKKSYLFERIYQGEGKENRDKLRYWTELLGEDVMQKIVGEPSVYGYLHDMPFRVSRQEWGEADRNLLHWERTKEKRDYLFYNFLFPFLKSGAGTLKEKIKTSPCWAPECMEDYQEALGRALETICMRTMIERLHWEKAAGNLKGVSKEAEYDFFCEELLSDTSYCRGILEEYPVLYRCMEKEVKRKTEFFAEIVHYYETEREVPRIASIRLTSGDTHQGGRQVAKVLLENGEELMYKPRPMENELCHQELLEWFAKKTGIDQRQYDIHSTSTHSWCSVIKKAACKSEGELAAYYERLGVQLFLAYVLGTKDLHSENLIAAGAYPVLIDLETLIQLPGTYRRSTGEEEIVYQLSHSVLYTGLLPFYVWKQDGKGVNASALGGMEGQVYPFRIPVVEHPKTSEMKIRYLYPKTEKNDNLATLNGTFCNPTEYADALIRGFVKAYDVVLRDREEFKQKITRLNISASRYLAADTQRYAMLLSASYHPELLRDGAERELFLHSMWLGRRQEEKNRQVIMSEIQDMVNGDIPHFHYNLKSKDLQNFRGKRIKDYFETPVIEWVFDKVEFLNPEDMERQCDFIRLSMELMPDKKKQLHNRVRHRNAWLSTKCANRRKVEVAEKRAALEKLVDRICQAAIFNKERTDVSWYGIELAAFSRQNWEVRPVNLYFYSGIAGMAVFFHQIRKVDTRKKAGEIIALLDKKLFAYTDDCICEKRKLQSTSTGMYEGESSIVYAYLLLYRIEKQEKYLVYAEKHSRIVERVLEQDTTYDLLYGNAGAARVFLFLYEETGEKHYKKQAQEALRLLEKAAVDVEEGMGWIVEENLPPMAGMAHGNSGILLPFLQMWNDTGEQQYLNTAKKILQYEDRLYDERIRNWRDVRVEGGTGIEQDKPGAVAWCHGAAGILLSRLECMEYVQGTELENTIYQDAERALQTLFEYPIRDSWCLCHGTCGNMLMLKQAAKWGKSEEIWELWNRFEEVLTDAVNGNCLEMLHQERVCYGLMNGWSGVAYALSECIENEIRDTV